MKLLQNFDTELKSDLLHKSLIEFGSKKTIFVQRSKVYLFLKVIFPIFLFGLTIFGFVTTVHNHFGFGVNLFFVIFSLSFIFLLLRLIIPALINYYMDYMIINPENTVVYSQYGILSRKVKEFQTKEIRFITTDNSGLLESLFGYGEINIFVESNYLSKSEIIDNTQIGRIHFEFASDTENLKKKIFHIVEYAKLYDQAKQEQFTENLTESKKEAYLQNYIGTKLQNLVGPALGYA